MQGKFTWKHIRADMTRGISESFELRRWSGPGKYETVGHVEHVPCKGWYFYARIGDKRINTAGHETCSLADAKHVCLAWVKEAMRRE